jgi:hypothetical protein
MELAIESLASSRRRQFWTKQEIVQTFIKRNPLKRTELAELAELDRRTHERLGLDGPTSYIHRERELERLHRLASRVMNKWDEEQYGLHRRFGVWRARLEGPKKKSEWRWFEIRYATVSFLTLWRDDKRVLYQRVGFRLEETDLILEVARSHMAQSVDAVYGEAMQKIAEHRA